jgi:hypothetical protein
MMIAMSWVQRLRASEMERPHIGNMDVDNAMGDWCKATRKMEPKDIDRELFEFARDWMSASKLKKLSGHVERDTDGALWKQFRDYAPKKGSIRVRLFRCPLRNPCGCMTRICIMESPTWKRLDQCKLEQSR